MATRPVPRTNKPGWLDSHNDFSRKATYSQSSLILTADSTVTYSDSLYYTDFLHLSWKGIEKLSKLIIETIKEPKYNHNNTTDVTFTATADTASTTTDTTAVTDAITIQTADTADTDNTSITDNVTVTPTTHTTPTDNTCTSILTETTTTTLTDTMATTTIQTDTTTITFTQRP